MGKKLFAKSGFSLIELLVVISIISLLAGLLLPSLLNAKLLAKRTVCAARLSAVGKATGLYQGDYGEFVPVLAWNQDPSLPHPWSWRMLLSPYTAGVDTFNCSAARVDGNGFEIIHNKEQMASVDPLHAFTLNLGSYGVMGYYLPIELPDFTGVWKPATPLVSSAYPVSSWSNPANSIYIADACSVKGAIEYPSQPPYKGHGTSMIEGPWLEEYDKPDRNIFTRRFADRHKGTNCVFLDGHVETFDTCDLDTMTEGDSDCVWDLE